MDCKTSYNAIIGRPSLAALCVVISPSPVIHEISNQRGIAKVPGNQICARECYVSSLRTKLLSVTQVDMADEEKETTRPKPGQPMEEVMQNEKLGQVVKFGSELPEQIKLELSSFLQEYIDVFAWSVRDMLSVDRLIIKQMNISLDTRPVIQKKRNLRKECSKATVVEVWKLLEFGLIREVLYPKWLANIVMVCKSPTK